MLFGVADICLQDYREEAAMLIRPRNGLIEASTDMVPHLVPPTMWRSVAICENCYTTRSFICVEGVGNGPTTNFGNTYGDGGVKSLPRESRLLIKGGTFWLDEQCDHDWMDRFCSDLLLQLSTSVLAPCTDVAVGP